MATILMKILAKLSTFGGKLVSGDDSVSAMRVLSLSFGGFAMLLGTVQALVTLGYLPCREGKDLMDLIYFFGGSAIVSKGVQTVSEGRRRKTDDVSGIRGTDS